MLAAASAAPRNPGKAVWITESIKTACNFDRLSRKAGDERKERRDKHL